MSGFFHSAEYFRDSSHLFISVLVGRSSNSHRSSLRTRRENGRRDLCRLEVYCATATQLFCHQESVLRKPAQRCRDSSAGNRTGISGSRLQDGRRGLGRLWWREGQNPTRVTDPALAVRDTVTQEMLAIGKSKRLQTSVYRMTLP